MSKGKHEKEFDYRQFLFKTISSNGQEITVEDLEEAVEDLNMREFKNKSFHRAIQIAEKSEHAQSMSHQAFEEQIFNLVNVKGSKRGGNFDAQSEA